MIKFLKKHFFKRQNVQENVFLFPLTPPVSAEKQYIRESLKLRGYLPEENVDIKAEIFIDFLLRKEGLAIVVRDKPFSTAYDLTQLTRLKKAINKQGWRLILFDRCSFYKDLSELLFYLRKTSGLSLLTPSTKRTL